jgi:hypothetical protein
MEVFCDPGRLMRRNRISKRIRSSGSKFMRAKASAPNPRVALDKANNVDIWIESTTGAGNSRFTFDRSEQVVGVWSGDGSMLAYRATIAGGICS